MQLTKCFHDIVLVAKESIRKKKIPTKKLTIKTTSNKYQCKKSMNVDLLLELKFVQFANIFFITKKNYQ